MFIDESIPNPVMNKPISAIIRLWLKDIKVTPIIDIVKAIDIDFFLPRLSFNKDTTI